MAEVKEAPKSAAQVKLDELAAQFGQVAHAVAPSGKLLVFRCPTLDEWEDHQENMGSGKKRRGACFRELAQLVVVEPTLEELQQEFTRSPGLPVRIHDGIAELVGAEVEFTVKKG